MYTNLKVAGLWIDHDDAYLVTTPDKMNIGDYSVKDKLKSGHKGSGHGISESKKQEDLHKFFRSVGTHLGGYDVIFVFGPGKAQEEFKNFMTKEGLVKAKMELGASDAHITSNQMISKVRDHFK
ncbi:MAG: hypothetical protein IPN89_09250 [Saprospiraceae bacterium]|nr:hypothetical protein [Saprospiraceae bacterium]